MPSPRSADRPSAPPPGSGPVDALISQARRLKGEVDAVRRDTQESQAERTGPRDRWQRALYDLALHHLEDLDAHLAQLREGPPVPRDDGTKAAGGVGAAPSSLGRVGTAEWNLLTDEASWSAELYRLLDRDPDSPPLGLDELPSLVLDEDRPRLTAMVTDCLVDARPIDGEFRVVRRDGSVRTVHMRGEPVLAPDGSTAAMWTVLRDVSELRRGQREVRETHEALRRGREHAATERRLALALHESVLPPWQGSLRLPRRSPSSLDLAAHCGPPSATGRIGGAWYDALELADGDLLVSLGDLTGQGLAVTTGIATLMGAVRGMAMAGAEPGRLLRLLNRLVDATAQPALGSAVCCRYRPETRTLTWAQAGAPVPLLFRDGTGTPLRTPDGAPLGAAPGAVYAQAAHTLRPGDLLVLHTPRSAPEQDRARVTDRLLALAPRLADAPDAQACARAVVEEFSESARTADACVLVARVTDGP